MSSIAERIELIIKELGYNKNSFSKAIGLTNNVTIGRIIIDKRDPSFDTLLKIIQTFDCINTNWLLTGEGPMLKEKEYKTGEDENSNNVNEAPVRHEANIDYKEKYITVLEKYNQLLEEVAELKANAVSTAKNTSAGKKSA